jgi:hypothetical protein
MVSHSALKWLFGDVVESVDDLDLVEGRFLSLAFLANCWSATE